MSSPPMILSSLLSGRQNMPLKFFFFYIFIIINLMIIFISLLLYYIHIYSLANLMTIDVLELRNRPHQLGFFPHPFWDAKRPCTCVHVPRLLISFYYASACVMHRSSSHGASGLMKKATTNNPKNCSSVPFLSAFSSCILTSIQRCQSVHFQNDFCNNKNLTL